MKRGLITWDRAELPREVLEARLDAARERASRTGAPALVLYTDVWRSNHVRSLSNFMPYWTRSLLVVPALGEPVLICGLSPRVYPWIRSVTPLEDIRPGKDLAGRLIELASQRGWEKLGLVEASDFPYDVYEGLETSGLELLPVDGDFLRRADDTEMGIRRKAVGLTRRILDEHMHEAKGTSDFELVSRLERAFRRAGVEDLVVWISDGHTAPRPASGHSLGEGFSVVAAAEYRGHWALVGRSVDAPEVLSRVVDRFENALRKLDAPGVSLKDLSGSHPFRAVVSVTDVGPEALVGVFVEHREGGRRCFYGDTCRLEVGGWAAAL